MADRILIVDDERDTIHALGALLELEQYETIRAYTGQEALDRALDSAPDAMLLDIMLPDIDGLEICRRLRADAATADLPVILITASGVPDIEELGLEAGANRVVRKPFAVEFLIEELAAVLQERRE